MRTTSHIRKTSQASYGLAAGFCVGTETPKMQVLAMDRRFGFAGSAAVLMLVQVQVLAVDWRFGFCRCCCRADAGAGWCRCRR